MKLLRYVVKVWGTPLLAIEWIMAVTSSISAFYFLSPLYAIGKSAHPTALTLVLTHPLMTLSLGIVLMIGAVLVMLGILLQKNNFRSAGWFTIFMVRLYQSLAILIVAGPLPLQWLTPLTLSLIVLVLWAMARSGADNHAP